jgi:histone deacetylase 6
MNQSCSSSLNNNAATVVSKDDDQLLEGDVGGGVIPITNCPHLNQIGEIPESIDAHKSCNECEDTKENWLCLTCYGTFCSRYVKKHMIKHSIETKHPIALSFSDM